MISNIKAQSDKYNTAEEQSTYFSSSGTTQCMQMYVDINCVSLQSSNGELWLLLRPNRLVNDAVDSLGVMTKRNGQETISASSEMASLAMMQKPERTKQTLRISVRLLHGVDGRPWSHLSGSARWDG